MCGSKNRNELTIKPRHDLRVTRLSHLLQPTLQLQRPHDPKRWEMLPQDPFLKVCRHLQSINDPGMLSSGAFYPYDKHPYSKSGFGLRVLLVPLLLYPQWWDPCQLPMLRQPVRRLVSFLYILTRERLRGCYFAGYCLMNMLVCISMKSKLSHTLPSCSEWLRHVRLDTMLSISLFDLWSKNPQAEIEVRDLGIFRGNAMTSTSEQTLRLLFIWR